MDTITATIHDNKYGKTSLVMLHAAIKNGRTVLKDVHFTAPFKIMNPFYIKKDFMTLMCMSASAGIMSGDEQEFQFLIEEGAKLEFISQSYEKIHKMESGMAKRMTDIHIKRDGCFYYNPLPTQPFQDSAFESIVNAHLEDNTSSFIMKEIITAGRCSRGEIFQYRFYHNLVNVYLGSDLIYRDNTRFSPTDMNLSGMGMHENHTHLGNLLLFNTPKSTDWITQARKLLDDASNVEGGITTLDNKAIIIRVLGNRGEQLEKLLDQLLDL